MTEETKSKYPKWSDQYSTLVLIQLAKGCDWKSKFQLTEQRVGEHEFLVRLKNDGKTFEGVGSSKKKAEHRASFKLLKTFKNLREIVKANSLQFLELANREGAGILADKMRINPAPAGGFVATYIGRSDLEIRNAVKKDAKRLLAYELLSPLWKEMDKTFANENLPVTPNSSPQRPAVRVQPKKSPPMSPIRPEPVAVLKEPIIKIVPEPQKTSTNSTELSFSSLPSSSIKSGPPVEVSTGSRASTVRGRFPHWNSDYYIPILTALAKSASWKDILGLKLNALTDGKYDATLIYEGSTFRGIGQGKSEATNDAAFQLICCLDGLDRFLEENCMAILEFAVRNGCPINRDNIRVEEVMVDGTKKFQCKYLAPGVMEHGRISQSKASAKKNLVFNLLKPLWTSLKREINGALDKRKETLYDEIDKLESKRDSGVSYESESLLSDYKTEAVSPDKSEDKLTKEIEALKKHLSHLELLQQTQKGTSPDGDATVIQHNEPQTSGYVTGRSDAGNQGDDAVSAISSKWCSVDFKIDDSISKIYK
ncbi:Oidioi.mRNA.OKI2018_I69.chr1.g3832.t1.cds [Oikopleura dioica]|uniref:Oidioi.mRNA.OKI2018_I69.chr1.g3832.t1.cds n=1 Tax=Oikopleura dioica TaxID=34765 RepID=A0ABN7SVC4_OIKDI|nr:Oidioi.mRNA.OKI2018_I69.chr1.g3832.t1.cds [Oikopleura dioica]